MSLLVFLSYCCWWLTEYTVSGFNEIYISRRMTKPTKWPVRPVTAQISLGICPVWSESSLSAWRKLGSLATHWEHCVDSGQTGWMPRLISVFAGRTGHFVGSFICTKTCLCGACFINWATSWENLFMPYASNKGADQSGHPRSLISAFVIRCLDGIISIQSQFQDSSLSL